MDSMKREGVKVAIARVDFNWTNSRNFSVAWIKYFSHYAFDELEFQTGKTDLEQVRASPNLDAELRQAAITRAGPNIARLLETTRMRRARGAISVLLTDDEWLPAAEAENFEELEDPDRTDLMKVARTCHVFWEGFAPPVPSPKTQAQLEQAHRRAEADVKRLLAEGADVNARDQSGESALLLAVLNCSEGLVRSLLEAGAEVNVIGSEGETPLIRAAARGKTEVVRLLLAYGADVNAKSEFGRTALSAAKQYGHLAVIKLLQEAGARE
jgi:hypothetical protein